MGAPDFSRKIFEKVFHEDIERLRSMEDMWKSREAPKVLQYDQIKEVVAQAKIDGASLASDDQSTWNLAESLAVFEDRYIYVFGH